MSSTQSLPEAPDAGLPDAGPADAGLAGDVLPPGDAPVDGRVVLLPANATTATAEDMLARLVLASDLEGEIIVDASEVESIGQAMFQILVAARQDALKVGQPFSIANPSEAFLARTRACRLAEAVGLPAQPAEEDVTP